MANVLGHGQIYQEVFDFYQRALSDEWRTSRPHMSEGLGTLLKYELLVNATAMQFAWAWKGFNESRDQKGFALKVFYNFKSALVVAANRFLRRSS